ncbi:glycosyltransferase [Lacrimispora sp.]|jgi:hypothetical protein|uniref:glycosyltransferase n=1 Tax=Lacrimispora sp. TaxID=2719234 RepID=UPI00289A3126|nr:glycosyltransferase [Lacrimispora sp.]
MIKKAYIKDCPSILVECPLKLPSVRVGVLDVLERFEKQGKCTVLFKSTFEINKHDLLQCDILITVRGCENMSLEIAKAAKKMGRFLIYYLDDDLLNLPETAISSEFYQRESNRNNIKNLIKLSDILWSNNEKIIEKYSKYGNHIRCVKTDTIAKTFKAHDVSQNGLTKILYAGSIDHTFLVEKYIVPALLKIITEYGDSIEVTFIGVDPKDCESKQIKSYKFIEDYDKYKEIVECGNFDIGLAVISTTEFYQCKYYNKFIEYTSIGAVGVYTKSSPYTFVVQNECNGILVENSIDSWYNGIKFLINQPQERNEYLERAQKQIKANFSEEFILKYLEKQIPEFTSFMVDDKSDYSFVRLRNKKWVYIKQRLGDYWKANKLLFFLNIIIAGTRILKRKIRG